MTSTMLAVLLWIGALSSGTMAGIYFAFSVFIMPAFNRISSMEAIVAMTAINEKILDSWFMPVFFGSTFVALTLMGLSVANFNHYNSLLMFSGSFLYLVGMFAFTALLNVPLNNELAKVASSTRSAAQAWEHYMTHWTKWNHVRTIASFVTSVMYIGALLI